ncbi:MAG: DUF4783 domain-containing protein [Ferruginibacter sp.]
MKRVLLFGSICLFMMAFSVALSISDIVNALKTGNAAEISRYFDNTVEITLPEKTNSYSKSQGEVILRDFFNNNTVKGFNIIHQGENAGSQYCIGTLVTSTASFRTTIYMKQKGNKQTLQEIRFENK